FGRRSRRHGPDSVGLVYVSHELLDGNIDNPDKRMDLYPEAVYVHDNTFTTNGTSPQPPEDGVIVCAPGTGPHFDSVPPCVPTGINDSDTSLLPALIQIKGALAAQNGDPYGPTGAHIVWDGYTDHGMDQYYKPHRPEDPAPPAVDCTAGIVLDPNAKSTDPNVHPDAAVEPEFAAILDQNGKPQYTGAHDPACRYNAYKFTDAS